jgi:hypothetical protein
MQLGPERRKHARTKKVPPLTLRISYEERSGFPKRELVVTLLDNSDDGLRIGTTRPLGVGSVVFLQREVAGKTRPWSARVTWCGLNPDGSYAAGLQLVALSAPGASPSDAGSQKADPDALPDYYEVLQLSSKADPDTVHRVYRLLAQRFHPDNPDTGNQDAFRKLLEAYRVLSDPEQRAAFDVKHGTQNQRRWKIFDQRSALRGQVTERRKREGILSILYTRRVNEPAQPAMSIIEMENLLGCPREHLEFSLWFLKEKSLIVKSDNGRYAITVNGAEAAESEEIPWAREDRLIESSGEPS